MYRSYISILVILISAVSIFSCKSDKPTAKYNHLYEQYFIADEINITRKSTEPTTLLQAHQAYNQGNYSLSASVLLGYEPTLEPPSRLAYAVSLIKTDQIPAALAQLKKLEPIPLYNNAGFWYQGLISLRGDVQK